jgi:hypothetical protein
VTRIDPSSEASELFATFGRDPANVIDNGMPSQKRLSEPAVGTANTRRNKVDVIDADGMRPRFRAVVEREALPL